MWFGTKNGLVRYDGYEMKVYQPDPGDSLSIKGSFIETIYEDRSGTLWIGTRQDGLNRFDRVTETFTRFLVTPNDSTHETAINFIYEDSSKNLFICL